MIRQKESEKWYIQCSICKRFKEKGKWIVLKNINIHNTENITTSRCKTCNKEFFKINNEFEKEMKDIKYIVSSSGFKHRPIPKDIYVKYKKKNAEFFKRRREYYKPREGK